MRVLTMTKDDISSCLRARSSAILCVYSSSSIHLLPFCFVPPSSFYTRPAYSFLPPCTEAKRLSLPGSRPAPTVCCRSSLQPLSPPIPKQTKFPWRYLQQRDISLPSPTNPRDKTTKRSTTSTKINITTNHHNPKQRGHQLTSQKNPHTPNTAPHLPRNTSTIHLETPDLENAPPCPA